MQSTTARATRPLVPHIPYPHPNMNTAVGMIDIVEVEVSKWRVLLGEHGRTLRQPGRLVPTHA